MVIFYGPINFDGVLVKNYITESKSIRLRIFYCAGIVMSEAFGKFRNTLPRVTNHVRAGRREPQPATEILLRGGMGETRGSHGK